MSANLRQLVWQFFELFAKPLKPWPYKDFGNLHQIIESIRPLADIGTKKGSTFDVLPINHRMELVKGLYPYILRVKF